MVLSAKQLEVGASLPPFSKKITYDLCRASTGPGESFHNSKEVANRMGFRDAVVAGPHLVCVISEALTQALGGGWIEGGKMQITFISPVYAEDTVTVNATVFEKTPEGNKSRVHVNITCENQDGTKTCVGSASSLVAG